MHSDVSCPISLLHHCCLTLSSCLTLLSHVPLCPFVYSVVALPLLVSLCCLLSHSHVLNTLHARSSHDCWLKPMYTGLVDNGKQAKDENTHLLVLGVAACSYYEDEFPTEVCIA